MRRVEKFVNSCSSVTIFKVQKWFSFTSGLTSPKIHVSLGTSSRYISIDLVAFFQKMVCFTKFWSTILEILVWELWAFCKIFVESALFLIFCLVSNWKPDSCEQGEGDRLTANVHIGKKYFHFINCFLEILYFLSNFYFSPNDSPSKTMKNVFYFI